VDDGVALGRGILAALQALHATGVVHRDLKPSNVFLTSRGPVKLLDFGIAKVVGPGGGEDPVHEAAGDVTMQTNVRLGTVGYMSPEQAKGLAIDARSDVFSFGAVLHEMLTGKRAFEGETVVNVLFAILTKESPPLDDVCREAPAALQGIVSRCMAKRPEDRFQSARDVEHALEAIVNAPVEPSLMRRFLLSAAALLLLAAAGGTLYVRQSPWGAAAPGRGAMAAKQARNAIAVLPLRNLSADPAHAYVAGGLHDELLTQLAKVAALRVIGRTSVMGYQGKATPLAQLADELGVGTVVEGSAQVVDGRLRVSVNLVDTSTSQLLWADKYDRTLDDTFAIQSEIAQRIVAGVGAALSDDEQQRVSATPTANPEAYRLYLQGREYVNHPGSLRANLRAAAQLYEKALELDPGFAVAHAALSRVYGLSYWFRYDPSPARAVRQREEAEEALRLAPDLPQAHIAMGMAHYFGRLDYRAALNELEIARRDLPNDAGLCADIGYANRRLGNWTAVAAAFARTTDLEPRSADNFYDLGGETFTLLHRYADAVRAYDRALTLAPDMYPAAYRRALAHVLWQGRLEPLRDVLASLPEEAALGAHGSVAAQRAALMLLERDADGLLQMLEVMRSADFEGHIFFLPSALYRGWAHQWRGDHAAARAAFESATARLDIAARDLPGDWRVHVARGLALAGHQRCEEAVAEAGWLRQSAVYRGDAHFGTIAAEGRAQILAQCGRVDAALDEIQRLLPGPSWLSVHTLRLDPRWDPIRSHPRFQALLEVYGS
jgi:TolB-like protein